MSSLFRRVRPVATAWLLGSLIALMTVATVFADGGGVPYPH